MNSGNVIGGRYRLVRPLGAGGMGEVWAAVDKTAGGEVAIKLLRKQSVELRKRLLREAHACGKLNHENVIAVHDVGETAEGDPFLVMQLLTGQTLAEHLGAEYRLSQRRAAQIACDVARALSAAHEAGVIHRDLKPANIFLHREGGGDAVVKVLDFGVSKVLDQSEQITRKGALIGSLPYMSPEQLGAPYPLDHRSDIWSLGVVLFQMLVGQKPFDSDAEGRDVEIFMKILYEPIPVVSQFVPDVDPALIAIVSRCLDRDPARRFGSAAELGAILDRFAQLAGPASRGSALASPPSPHRARESNPVERGTMSSWERGVGQPLEQPTAASSVHQRPDADPSAVYEGATRAWPASDQLSPTLPMVQLPDEDVVTAYDQPALQPPLPPAPGAVSPLPPGAPIPWTPPQPASRLPSSHAPAEGGPLLRPDGMAPSPIHLAPPTMPPTWLPRPPVPTRRADQTTATPAARLHVLLALACVTVLGAAGVVTYRLLPKHTLQPAALGAPGPGPSTPSPPAPAGITAVAVQPPPPPGAPAPNVPQPNRPSPEPTGAPNPSPSQPSPGPTAPAPLRGTPPELPVAAPPAPTSADPKDDHKKASPGPSAKVPSQSAPPVQGPKGKTVPRAPWDRR